MSSASRIHLVDLLSMFFKRLPCLVNTMVHSRLLPFTDWTVSLAALLLLTMPFSTFTNHSHVPVAANHSLATSQTLGPGPFPEVRSQIRPGLTP